MRHEVRYRLFFNNEPATREQLDRVDTVTIEQEVDMAWEARLEIPTCLDRRGNWPQADLAFVKSFARVRVEVSIGGNPFVPLIDGTVVTPNMQMSFDPGKSSLTVTVQDDSILLNREDQYFSFDGESDEAIAETLYGTVDQIAETDIESEGSFSGSNEQPDFRQTGTAMQVLRCLARRQGKHAYVLPGDNPGESIGVFRAFSSTSDVTPNARELPTLMLLGSQANLQTFNVQQDATRPARFTAASLRTSDREEVSSRERFDERAVLLGDRSALPEREAPGLHILRPSACMAYGDLDRTVGAEAERSSYGFTATGEVLGGCYTGVLQPYRLVTVQAGGTPYSGTYVIAQVTHTLSRSIYSQSFALTRNAESETSTKSVAEPQPRIA
jgi:hypothetical protein